MKQKAKIIKMENRQPSNGEALLRLIFIFIGTFLITGGIILFFKGC